MTTSVIAGRGRPAYAEVITGHFRDATSRLVTGRRRRCWRNAMITPGRSPGHTCLLVGAAFSPASPPGVIGGAVIKAARCSAGLNLRQLARKMRVSRAAMRSWEAGSCPLFCMSYDQLRRLAAALDQPARRCDLDELLLASQCDLLVTGMLQGFEDYAEVPPIDEPGPEGERAQSLLRWALIGDVPDRYCPPGAAHPLLVKQDVLAFEALAQDLKRGSQGDQISSYGAALAALVER
jgi:transcriptional regulator with XRE-family HTH domain